MIGLYNVGVYFIGFIAGVATAYMILDAHYLKQCDQCFIRNMERQLMIDIRRDEEMSHYCADCGEVLQEVRPGKFQCNNDFCPAKIWTVEDDIS